MEEKISPQFQIHGVALEKCGVGILLLGEAGSGKSSVALTLLKRGARLIADDAVMIRKDREGRLAAKPHPQVRGSLHVRHKGLIRVAEVFGAKALSDSCFIDICFRLND
ncbi:MAG: HPr kinase/phosphorylase, partial [Acidobacteriota bacterium]|nr:HPr kinase/phosphorylase [Acidobacteriota bacterium]